MINIINKVHKYMQKNRIWNQRAVKNITRITIHHDTIANNGRITDEECLTNIYNTHTSTNPNRYRNYPGIAYHYWISKKGVIYKINNHQDLTWHDGINDDSIGICLNGFFHSPYNENPTKEQLKALKSLLVQLCTEHPEFPASYDGIRGHKERKSTACPGNNLMPYVKEFRKKSGNVNWGDTEVKPRIISFDIDKDIPTEIEQILGLREMDKYMKSDLKRMSMTKLLEYLINKL